MTEEDLDGMVSELERDLMFLQDKYDQIQDKMGQIEDFKNDLEKHVDVQASNIDFDRLAEFVSDKYWLVNQKEDNTYEIFIPNFMDVQAGVLDRQKGGYNVFILDQTTKMISGIPEFLQDEVDLDVEQKFKVKGDLLEFDEDQKSTVENELDEYVDDVKDDRATIKQDHGHSLVRDLLERGEMPFSPTQVDNSDLRDSATDQELRPYQERAFNEWMDHGAITVCFMTGAGKTHIGMEAFDVLNYDEETGRKAVVVFSKITAKQWKNRIEKYAPRMKPVIMSGKDVEDIPEGEEVVEIYTYQALHKMEEMINSGHRYMMIQFDECVTGDTRVRTINGSIRIGELADRVFEEDEYGVKELDTSIQALDDGNNKSFQSAKILKKEAETIEIELEDGSVLETTESHPHLVFDTEKFEVVEKKASELEKNDYLIEEFDNGFEDIYSEVSELEAYLEAFILGDGHIFESTENAGRISFGSDSLDEVKVIESKLEKLGFDFSLERNSRGDYNFYIPEANHLINGDHKGRKAKTVEVPSYVFVESKEIVSSFLSGIFDAEGSVNSNGTIGISMVSDKMIRDIQMLLRKFGIRSTIIEEENNHYSEGSIWTLRIMHRDRIKFAEEIGFEIPRKMEEIDLEECSNTGCLGIDCGDYLREIRDNLSFTENDIADMMNVGRGTVSGAIHDGDRLSYDNLYNLALGLGELQEKLGYREDIGLKLYDLSPLSYKEIADRSSYCLSAVWNHFNKSTSMDKIKDIEEEVWEGYYNELGEYISKLHLLDNSLPVRIDEIREKDEKKNVYDFEIQKDSRFLANGIVTHNCDFLPAKTFSKASTYPTKYRMGHTASPVRSRESPNDVFALCGKPVGMNWQETLEHMEQEMFPVNIHVVKDRDGKVDRTEEILDSEKTTVIVVWNIEYGEKLAERLGLEFVHGETNGDQKEKIQDAIEEDNAVVASQIVRRGVTLETIERIIEVDRRGDSRRDTLQLVGRLFHGHGELAEIVYTVGEANSFEDTFYGLIEKGFEMNDVDDALEMEDLGDQADSIVDIEIEEESEDIPTQRKVERSTTVEEDPIEFLKDEKVKEIIDERAENYDQLGKGTIWEGVIAIAQEQSESGNGLSHDDIQELGITKTGYKVTSPMKEDPQILVKDDGKWKLNIEEINEIKQKEEKKAEKKKQIQDLKQEVGIE